MSASTQGQAHPKGQALGASHMQANRNRIPMKRIRTGGIGRDRQKNALKGPFAARRTIFTK